jgi:predicted ATPase
LLREAPLIKVVVTTRVVLRVYGERDFAVPPLGMPAAGVTPRTAQEAAAYEAVRLFVERAQAVQPQFMLTDANAQLVVEIVRRLDGLPLAIELAAARTRSLPVAALHARLDQHLSLLTGGSRDLPGRQQTLRGAIDWSYDLLEEPDRRLFERFAVHAGGAFLTQVEEVCGPAAELGEDVLDGLTSLTEKSLLKSDVGADEDPRYAMLTTIRDYAREHLEQRDELPELTRRHAQTYLALVERLAPELSGPHGRSVGDRLEQDHDNLRAALDWAIATGDSGYALRFITAIWRFWQVRGHVAEARRRVDAVMAMAEVGRQSAVVRAKGYGAAGSIAYWQADVPEVHRLYGLALAAARESGDEALVAEALYNFGFAATNQPSMNSALYAAGRASWEEALDLYRKLGDARGVADASWGIAMALQGAGDRDAAIRHGEEALAGYRSVGDPLRIGWGLYLLAGLRVADGDLELVETYLRESLETFTRANDRAGILLCLTGFALLASSRGQLKRANRIGGAVESLRIATGASLLDAPIELVDFVKPTRPVDDPDSVAEWDAGALMSGEEAAAYALSDADTT